MYLCDKTCCKNIKNNSTFASFDRKERNKSKGTRSKMLDVFSWLLRAAAAEAHFPFPWEGVAEGRGRGVHSGRQTAACHNEF